MEDRHRMVKQIIAAMIPRNEILRQNEVIILQTMDIIRERILKMAAEQGEIINSAGQRICRMLAEQRKIINSTAAMIPRNEILRENEVIILQTMDYISEKNPEIEGTHRKLRDSNEGNKTSSLRSCGMPEDEKSLFQKALKKLLEDFKGLLDSGENSDVKLVVRGKEFLAHRLILSTRSPVFKAMLCHDTSERDSGTVDIDDCDPDTFQDFLDYMYTGSTEHVNIENMISLYATSDKYLMVELKAVCVSFMKANMSVEKFCDIATMALLYAEEDLLEFSKDFFFKNSKNIIDSKNWDAFFKENPKEAYEHFLKPLISNR